MTATTTALANYEVAVADAERLGANIDPSSLGGYVTSYLPARSLSELADMLVNHAQTAALSPFDMDAQVQINAIKRELVTRQPPF